MSSQHLRRGQDQVGRGRAFGQRAGEFHADDFRREHVDRLAEHDGLGFDSADSPADDAQAVDHRGVAVRAHQAVGVRDAVFRQHDIREVFEIDLVDDSRRWRDDSEVVKRLLSPAEKLVAFLVAFEFLVDVEGQRAVRGELIDLHGVINDQVARHQRIDLLRFAAHADHRRPQCGQIDDGRNAGKVLQHDAAGFKRQLGFLHVGRVPGREVRDVVLRHDEIINVPQQRFEEHSNRKRQPIDVRRGFLAELRQAVELKIAALRVQGRQGAE